MIRIIVEPAYRDHPTDPTSYSAHVSGGACPAYGWGLTRKQALANVVARYRKRMRAARSKAR